MSQNEISKLWITPSFIERMLPHKLEIGDGFLFGLIAEESTCVGFLLAGIGDGEKVGEENFLAVNAKTSEKEIMQFFDKLYHRKDIAIILIESHISKRLTGAGRFFKNTAPIVLEIPSVSNSFKVEEDMFVGAATHRAVKQNIDVTSLLP